MRKIKKIILFMTMALLLLLPVAASMPKPVAVEAAAMQFTGWKKEGTTWYYLIKGKKQTGWLNLKGKKYYLMPGTGKMVTGRRMIGKYCYSFDKTGAMRTNMWVKDSGGKWYFFQKNGRAIKNSWKKDKGRYYWLGSDYKMVTGLKVIDGNTYYFSLKSTEENPLGAMCTGWQTISGKRYYFSSSGTMYKGWLTTGGKKYYLQKNGVVKTGWHISNAGDRYYLNVPRGERVVNTTMRISGATWKFDAKGIATKVAYTINSSGQVEVWDKGTKYYLKKEFASHPGVASGAISDEELLAAVVYCEAGDQGLAGMTAVALTILNRVDSDLTYYPDTLRYVIYQSGQYAVVENGSLLRRLKNLNGEEASNCRKAVKAAYATLKKYQISGTPRRVSGITTAQMGGKKDFDCLFFMMDYSFRSLGLNWSRCETFQYRDHVFFTKWSK